MIFESLSVADTESIAIDFASRLSPGDVIALEGDLGAGKTQFVRGLLKGLGGDPRTVSSPTFVLLNIYDTGRLTLYHLDGYRAHGADDLESIGFSELLEQGGIVAIEWPSRLGDLLPTKRWTITITPMGLISREIDISRAIEGYRAKAD